MKITLGHQNAHNLTLRVGDDMYLWLIGSKCWSKCRELIPCQLEIAIRENEIKEAIEYVKRTYGMSEVVFETGSEKMAKKAIKKVFSKYKLKGQRVLVL